MFCVIDRNSMNADNGFINNIKYNYSSYYLQNTNNNE